MIVFGLVFLFVAGILIGVGIVIGLVGCGLAAVLLGLGVVSSSVLIGVRTKRPATAIRAFLIQAGLIAGIPAGAVCAWLGNEFVRSVGDAWVVPLYGAIGGAVAGVAVALVLDFLSRALHGWVLSRRRLIGGG